MHSALKSTIVNWFELTKLFFSETKFFVFQHCGIVYVIKSVKKIFCIHILPTFPSKLSNCVLSDFRANSTIFWWRSARLYFKTPSLFSLWFIVVPLASNLWQTGQPVVCLETRKSNAESTFFRRFACSHKYFLVCLVNSTKTLPNFIDND